MRDEIKAFFKGEVLDDVATLELYSKDASLFKVRPQLVVYPQDSADLKELVRWVNLHPGHSITVRAAGSDMTGGPLSESIVADVTKHMNHIGEIKEFGTFVEPGAFYRDFEKKTLEKGLILPCFTASKNLCALGGMLGNNCAGEKTLRYGKMEKYVLETKVIFSDGNERIVKPLSGKQLEDKLAQRDFEGILYRSVFDLVAENKDLLEEARPKVSKNSAGYYLWNVWDGVNFNLNRLLVGSQGTLGIITEARLDLVKEKTHHDLVALFFKSWDDLPKVVNAILPHEPESLETFDSETLKLGMRFMPEIAKKTGSNLFSFAAKFLPEVLIGIKMMGLPKLIILVEVAENSEAEVKYKVKKIEEAIKPFKVWSRVVAKDSEEEKFWVMRRESFNLLRQHVKGKRTAPFVDDFCIPVEHVPQFLPRAKMILDKYDINVNIAGHAGNGNFHIIPLMNLKEKGERDKITKVSGEFFDLVHEYKGTISGEHNDGIVRTPYLNKMYSPEVLEIFKKVKEIFDPKNIFNPGKKVPYTGSGQVGGTIEYLESHIAVE